MELPRDESGAFYRRADRFPADGDVALGLGAGEGDLFDAASLFLRRRREVVYDGIRPCS